MRIGGILHEGCAGALHDHLEADLRTTWTWERNFCDSEFWIVLVAAQQELAGSDFPKRQCSYGYLVSW
jgi:hypothetical protein